MSEVQRSITATKEGDVSATESVTCPFCGEDGFDLRGLKTHFEFGWCDAYENTERFPSMREEMASRQPERESGNEGV